MLEYYRFKTVRDLFLTGQAEEARQEMATLQRRYVALCAENTSLKIQMQEYKDILYLSRNLSFDGRFYWLATGGIRQGPFCPVCYDRDGLLIRLSGDPGDRHCSHCLENFREEPDMAAAVPLLAAEGWAEAPLPAGRGDPPKARVLPFRRPAADRLISL
ncbi:MAG: hypothetical protein LBO77_02575 [Desulfovibrio sp.]|jgi:hypothetical protein|nr:hypothetical protein [Desulfovibrio sp.]